MVVEDRERLDARLRALSRVGELLVGMDFDGTISPIVPVPADARPAPAAVGSLRALAKMPRTHVAVVSGRSLHDLTQRVGKHEKIRLVGSHGGEFGAAFLERFPPEALERRRRVCEALARIAADAPETEVESKTTGAALHYRNASRRDAACALRAARNGIASEPGVIRKRGKRVLELSVIPVSKAAALQTLRAAYKADSVLFVGDDRTDEDVFRELTDADVGVKVGAGRTAAGYRVPDVQGVCDLLAALELYRGGWASAAI